jgi:4-hydroxy-tetrahydrodipicolinate synthase
MKEFKGIFAIMSTPFDQEGQVDVDSIQTLVEFNIEKGVHGLTILGILGEANKLNEQERETIIGVVIDQVAGRIPVVVGTSAGGTDLTQYYSKRAVELGADGIMVAPPTNVKNLDAVYEYYRRVAAAVSVAVVVQDEPNFSGVLMPPDFLVRVCKEIPNCAYIKLEEAPTPQKLSRTKALLKNNVGIFGGLGGVYFLEEMVRGASGTMTGFAFPEILVDIYNQFQNNDLDKARSIFYEASPLIRYEGQIGIGLAIRKEILKKRGAILHSSLRHPGPSLDQAHLDELDILLEYMGVVNK